VRANGELSSNGVFPSEVLLRLVLGSIFFQHFNNDMRKQIWNQWW